MSANAHKIEALRSIALRERRMNFVAAARRYGEAAADVATVRVCNEILPLPTSPPMRRPATRAGSASDSLFKSARLVHIDATAFGLACHRLNP